MNSPAISVVLPVHNGQLYIEESVRSILTQDFEDFELIVGDDGSTDGTDALLNRLAAEDTRIRVLRRPEKSGLARSANWVVSSARAPLVAIAHADDISRSDRLRRMRDVLSKNSDAVLVGSMAEGIDAEGRVTQPPNFARLLKSSSFAPFAHSTIMFRTAAFHRVGGYRTQANIFEDLDLYWRLGEVGRILVIPDVLGSYRHSNASVRTRYGHRIEEALAVMYLCVSLHRRGRDWSHLLGRRITGRIHPRIFVARSWVPLWNGWCCGMLERMLAKADLRLNMVSLQSLGFVIWASLSPRTLRWLLRQVSSIRNLHARRRLAGLEAVEWDFGKPQ